MTGILRQRCNCIAIYACWRCMDRTAGHLSAMASTNNATQTVRASSYFAVLQAAQALLDLLNLLKSANKQLVGHNCFYDLVFLFNAIEGPSNSWQEFQRRVTSAFPVRSQLLESAVTLTQKCKDAVTHRHFIGRQQSEVPFKLLTVTCRLVYLIPNTWRVGWQTWGCREQSKVLPLASCMKRCSAKIQETHTCRRWPQPTTCACRTVRKGMQHPARLARCALSRVMTACTRCDNDRAYCEIHWLVRCNSEE